MNEKYNKTYYLVTDKDGDDKLFTSKRKARAEAKRKGTTDIMIFHGCKDDELALYVGQL